MTAVNSVYNSTCIYQIPSYDVLKTTVCSSPASQAPVSGNNTNRSVKIALPFNSFGNFTLSENKNSGGLPGRVLLSSGTGQSQQPGFSTLTVSLHRVGEFVMEREESELAGSSSRVNL